MQKELTKQEVKKHITDWIKRLDALFAQLEDWSLGRSDCEIKKAKITQINESLMHDYHVVCRLFVFDN